MVNLHRWNRDKLALVYSETSITKWHIIVFFAFSFFIPLFIPIGLLILWYLFKNQVRWQRKTFGELDDMARKYAVFMKRNGVGRGKRVLVLVPPSPELVATVSALIEYIGAVPVAMNPLVGFQWFIMTAGLLEPAAVICPWFLKPIFSLICARSTVITPDMIELDDNNGNIQPIEDRVDDDIGLIVYTTGSTGSPKPVAIPNVMMSAQEEEIRSMYPEMFSRDDEKRGEVNDDDYVLVCVAYWLLMMVSMGKTALLPCGNITRPASLSPSILKSTIAKYKSSITTIFASPIVFKNLTVAYNNAKLPDSIKLCVTGGTYLSYPLAQKVKAILHDSTGFDIVYGATEVLPIARISLDEFLSDSIREKTMNGQGICAGRPSKSLSLFIASLESNSKILEILEVHDDDRGKEIVEMGEIVVSGKLVSPQYVDGPRKEHHFMGDVGYLDFEGLLWYGGRVKDVLRTGKGHVPTVCVESIADKILNGPRTALTPQRHPKKKSDKSGILWIESGEKKSDYEEEKKRILEAVNKTQYKGCISRICNYPKSTFPFDSTHQSKIRRDIIFKESPY